MTPPRSDLYAVVLPKGPVQASLYTLVPGVGWRANPFERRAEAHRMGDRTMLVMVPREDGDG